MSKPTPEQEISSIDEMNRTFTENPTELNLMMWYRRLGKVLAYSSLEGLLYLRQSLYALEEVIRVKLPKSKRVFSGCRFLLTSIIGERSRERVDESILPEAIARNWLPLLREVGDGKCDSTNYEANAGNAEKLQAMINHGIVTRYEYASTDGSFHFILSPSGEYLMKILSKDIKS
jgi:hypothetical protein